jgi:hypothetical protein
MLLRRQSSAIHFTFSHVFHPTHTQAKPLRLPDPEEKEAATAKLEKKLAKQRAIRMAAIEQSAIDADGETKTSTQYSDSNEISDTSANVLPKYEGDQFGCHGPYLKGMMYLSRMADSSTKMKRKKDLILETHLKRKAEAEEEERSRVSKIEEEERSRLTNPDYSINTGPSSCYW